MWNIPSFDLLRMVSGSTSLTTLSLSKGKVEPPEAENCPYKYFLLSLGARQNQENYPFGLLVLGE
jgi:hypothetical protein